MICCMIWAKSSLNINRSRMIAFRAFVKQCGFFYLGFSGPAYTWKNKRFTSNPIFQRLDRCLVNPQWCVAFLFLMYITCLFFTILVIMLPSFFLLMGRSAN
jgi:quinol-cytochrome oxidoreductase complex cytochrome b subunit